MNSGHVHRLVNDCGTRDNILVLSQAGILLMGMAGRVGFNGFNDARFLNRYFEFGHGVFFTYGGAPDSRFMSEWWLPVLTSDARPVKHDVRKGSTWNGFWTFVLNNAEPIKVVAYASIPLALSVLFFSLWRGEKEARATAEANKVEALRNLSASLAARAAAVRVRFPQRSLLLLTPPPWRPPSWSARHPNRLRVPPARRLTC
jgi:hypothetical protein